MSEISPILVVQNKKAKISDMAKVAIKRENITSFGGIYHVMDVFSRLGFEKLTETVVGKRGSSGKAYSYGSIFASLFFSYLCGGECLEDINTLVGHFRQRLRQNSPFRKMKTSDFFRANLRTFDAKHPYFCPKKSDVLLLPENLNIYNPIKFDGGCRVFVIHAQPPSRV